MTQAGVRHGEDMSRDAHDIIMTDLAQARIDIGELLAENRRLEDALDGKELQ
jgi:hypothetical protein